MTEPQDKVRVKAKVDPQLGPVEALGVALSIPMSGTEMVKCQELAKPMLAHLARLGWFLVSDGKDEAIRSEMERLKKENLELGLRVAMKDVDDRSLELDHVRADITRTAAVVQALWGTWDDPADETGVTYEQQKAKLLSLLAHERDLTNPSEAKP